MMTLVFELSGFNKEGLKEWNLHNLKIKIVYLFQVKILLVALCCRLMNKRVWSNKEIRRIGDGPEATRLGR